MDQNVAGLKIKEWLLLAFVSLCVILILLVWWEGLYGEDQGRAGFVRPTTEFEIDEEAYEDWNASQETMEPARTATPTTTPAPTGEEE